MVENFLKNLYQEYYEKKLNLEQENQRLVVELNNNVKLTETLKNSLDEDFESFFPRKVEQDKHMEIDSLTEEQNVISKKISKLQTKIENVDMKIEEVEELLKNIRENQRYIDIPLKQDKNNALIINFTSILNKVEMCNKLVDIDPVRCKLELEMIEKNIKKIIQELDTLS